MKKTIILIDPSGTRLKTIKSFLSEINATCDEFTSIEGAELAMKSPDLIIFLVESGHSGPAAGIRKLKTSVTLDQVPRIFIVLPDFMKSLHTQPELKDETSLSLFVDKLKFHSVLAEMLNIPLRRCFRIIIGIQPEDTSLHYSGVSIDFSESGIAFECLTGFPEGKIVGITFINPKSRKRFRLDSEIMRVRSNASKTQFFHGARFVGMSVEDKKDLMIFIKGDK